MSDLPALHTASALVHAPDRAMLVVTTDELPGRKIVRVLGLVRGNTVRTRHIGLDILAGFKTIVGGEVLQYTEMLAQSREQSLDRMCAEALALGADAIVAVRFTTASVMTGAAEILVYGTAVISQPLP